MINIDFYHGTTKAGLTELQPFTSPYSNLKEPLVYLTSSKQLALHCIWDTEKQEIKMPMFDIRKNHVFTCVTSSSPVPIVDYEFVDDVYEKRMKISKRSS